MLEIRLADQSDLPFWRTLDRHIAEDVLSRKLAGGECYVLTLDGERAAILRYNLFWDSVPFCTLLYVADAHQRKGLGRALMARWEDDMRALGHGMAMVSTQVDEAAQHFYRALGYRDAGGFVPDVPGYEQPMELIMVKDLRAAVRAFSGS